LTIVAGTSVDLAMQFIRVDGSLNIEGKIDSPVTITGVDDGTATSNSNYISTLSATITINNLVMFVDSSNSAIEISAGTVVIENSNIRNMNQSAINLSNDFTATINDTVLCDSGRHAISISSVNESSVLTVNNSIICNNDYSGILLNSIGSVSLTNNIFRNNGLALDINGGIKFKRGWDTIISHNLFELTATASGILLSEYSLEVASPIISFNDFIGTEGFAICSYSSSTNPSTDTIPVNGNYWGSEDVEIINIKILDKDDDFRFPDIIMSDISSTPLTGLNGS